MENSTQSFLTHEQAEQIEQVCTEFHGQLDDLYKAVGMMVVGQLYGWKVMRLVSARSTWTTAIKLFGDPKTLMPDEGKLWRKSYGYSFIKKSEKLYWDFVKGQVPMPKEERAAVL
jgi:hypothetical protein